MGTLGVTYAQNYKQFFFKSKFVSLKIRFIFKFQGQWQALSQYLPLGEHSFFIDKFYISCLIQFQLHYLRFCQL